MAKYMVHVTEVVHYLVPVTAANEEQAMAKGEEKVCNTRDRDKWVVEVSAREPDGCELASKPRHS